MDRQLIKSLIDALAASDLSELQYSAGGETLRLVKGTPSPVVPTIATSPTTACAPTPAASATPVSLPSPVPASLSAPPPIEKQDSVVSAPAYGIVHLQRTPGAPPLVSAGDAVLAGQVLCLMEAMKVFTELRAERAETIAAVLVETGQEVEAGQPLFRMGA